MAFESRKYEVYRIILLLIIIIIVSHNVGFTASELWANFVSKTH
jgi:hypothetical protein